MNQQDLDQLRGQIEQINTRQARIYDTLKPLDGCLDEILVGQREILSKPEQMDNKPPYRTRTARMSAEAPNAPESPGNGSRRRGAGTATKKTAST